MSAISRRGRRGSTESPLAEAPAGVRAPKQPSSVSVPDDLHVTRDRHYLEQLQEEAGYWDDHVGAWQERAPSPEVQRYYNMRMTGDAERRWYETISGYSDFRRGCVLGAGPGQIERALLEHHGELQLTIHDISGVALDALHGGLEQEFPGRTTIQAEDLNFVTLAEGAYDLVIADSTIHHLVNLEHVAGQINRCLTPDGLFFMHDVVSESYFQFDDEKKRLFQNLADATADGQRPAQPIPWPDPAGWTFSPFESARSGEILGVLAQHLREVSVRTAGPLLALTFVAFAAQAQMNGGSPPRLGRRLRNALLERLGGQQVDAARVKAKQELLFQLDSILSDTGYFKPGLAFAIYQKREASTSA